MTLTKTLPGSTCVPMPSLVLIGPAVRPAIGNRQTDRQTDKHIAFYYVDSLWLAVQIIVLGLKFSGIGLKQPDLMLLITDANNM